jgi:hypothetical protein
MSEQLPVQMRKHTIMIAGWEHQLVVALTAFHIKYAGVSRLNKYNLPTKTRWWKSKILYALTDNSSTVHLDIIKLLFRILHIRIICANVTIDWHWDVEMVTSDQFASFQIEVQEKNKLMDQVNMKDTSIRKSNCFSPYIIGKNIEHPCLHGPL